MRISEAGLIGTDGRLRLPMDRLNQTFARFPGKRVVVTFDVMDDSTRQQHGYYRQYVLPTIVQAFWETGERMTEERAEQLLLSEYPGKAESVADMDKQQMSDFLSWLKQYAAENLYVYIEDPK